MQEEMMGVRGDFVEQIVAESGSFLNTAVAFANGRGGRIIFYGEGGRGFSTELEIIPYIDEVTRQIFESCEPRIFPRVGVELQDGRPVVVVEIFPGMEKPYFLKEAGMMDGTYVRVGGATRLAEPYQVQELLLSGTNSSADQLAAQTLVDEVEIEEFCRMMYSEAKKRRTDGEDVVRLQKEELLSWKLLREEEGECRATHGWHLLAGTADELFPEGFVQCAEYLGSTRLDFVGGEEFFGSLMEQVDGAASYVQERLASRGVKARGLSDLPQDLVHRLIARAVCQRNYAAPGRISLVLYEDRLEITVPGLLEEDMTIWKLKTGFAKIRNRAIAAAFCYMGMMSGFQSILPELYRAAKQAHLPEPAVITLGDSVRINLYCRAEEDVQPEIVAAEETVSVEEDGSAGTSEPAEEAALLETAMPAEEFESIDEAGSVETSGWAEEAAPVEESGLAGEAMAVEEAKREEIAPAEEIEPTEEAASVEEEAPTEEAVPAEEEAPTEEAVPAEEAVSTEEAVPEEAVASVEDGLPEDAAPAKTAEPVEEIASAEEAVPTEATALAETTELKEEAAEKADLAENAELPEEAKTVEEAASVEEVVPAETTGATEKGLPIDGVPLPEDVAEAEPAEEEKQEAEHDETMEVDSEHELDLDLAPELKLEIESLAELKADAPSLEEEPAEPCEEKANAAQQELSFAAEEPAEKVSEGAAEGSLEEKLLGMIRENPKVTQKALKEALGISIATVKRMTTALHKAGVIERTGTNRSGAWRILKD
ncbi:ATP-binding protein [uncultured Selenomonas sp.]|uniref:ATP-binding protein n=1 Tax=uncultured Selenomonas sp. TaxID=159275 RepID=UPI0028DB8B5D|nr:ATP-binding protein [uncultured Selenomonas sp.]